MAVRKNQKYRPKAEAQSSNQNLKKNKGLERKASAEDIVSTSVTTPEKKGLPTAAKVVIVAVIIGIIVFLAKGLFVVALVNGQPVTRYEVLHELESQGGKQVSSSLITKAIIMQGFSKKHITVSQQEIDAEIKRISNQVKQQGGTLDQMLAAQGETQKSFAERVKIQLMAQKLFADKLIITDTEVQSYIDNNKQDPTIANATDDAALHRQIKNQLGQQKLRDAFQAWVTQLEKNSSVIHFVNY